MWSRFPPIVMVLSCVACLDSKEGRVGDVDASGTTADTSAPSDTAPADTASAPDTSSPADTRDDAREDSGVGPDTITPGEAVPTGVWTREYIGDCLHYYETLVIAGETATWTLDDDDYCGEAEPVVVRTGSARKTGDHVLELALGPDLHAPAEAVWTWAIQPGTPETLHTSAYRRVGDSDHFRRTDYERHDNDYGGSERRLEVDVRLVGYPNVTEMIVDFDVSQTFGDRAPPRGDEGQLRWPAERRVLPSGRVVFVAGDYEVQDHASSYPFSQELLERFDSYTVDLITAAFAPVMWEVEGDPGSLVVMTYGPSWQRAVEP